MAIDPSVLEKSFQRKRGLIEKLGDAGRFLSCLLRGGDVSPVAIHKTMDELHGYLATCHDQIDEVGQQWDKTDRQLASLKDRLKSATRAARSAILAQAEILLRKCDGFQDSVDKLKANALAGEVLVAKLRDLLILVSGPMPEDAIDQWTVQLEAAVAERTMADRALMELDKTSQRAVVAVPSEAGPAATEQELERISTPEARTEQERAVEQRLEELFE
jgi:chromosome segregation ATPase